MAGGQVICSDEEQHQHPGGVQRGRRTLCARIGAVSTCQGQEADSDIEQGQAKRKRDGDTAQREGHLLCSPFAYTHRPEFADKGQAFAKHLAARLSQQEEGSTANLDNLPRSSSLGPASPAAETQQPATEGPEYHSPASSRQRTPDQLSGRNLRMLEESTLNEPGCTRCAGRAAFQRELYSQRCIAESEYVDRLKSLAQAARSLEMVMRSTAVRSAAESHRGCMDLEALMAMCVSDVKRALDKDRQGRKQLQAELRAATRAYKGVLPDRQAEDRAQALQDECATLHAMLVQQRSSAAAHLGSAADQLQAERESHRIALEHTTRQFIKERIELQRRLQAQADEIAQLTSSKPGSGVQP